MALSTVGPNARRRELDAALLGALGLLFGGAAALYPAATTLALSGVVAVTWRPGVRAGLVLGVLLSLVSAARARDRLTSIDLTYAVTAAWLRPPSRCLADGIVRSSPVVLGDRLRADLELTAGECGERPVPRGVWARVYYAAPDDLARGDRVRVIAGLGALERFDNPELASRLTMMARTRVTASGGALDVQVLTSATSLPARIDRARAHVRRRIQATYHPSMTGLGRALVLGENDLDDDTRRAFRDSGLSHLLAVSGSHLVFAVVAVTWALRALLLRVPRLARRHEVGRLAAAAGIPLTWLYADFAGGGGSASRAAAMLTVALLSRALGRRPDGARCLALSVGAAALVDPLALFDVSFMLSAAATTGLLAVAPWLFEALRSRLVPCLGPRAARSAALGWLLRAVAVTSAATLACAPVLLMLSPGLPASTVLANVVAAPVAELGALPVCLLHAASSWAPPLERGAAFVGSGALWLLRAIAGVGADLGGQLRVPPPGPWHLATLALGVAAWGGARVSLRRVTVATMVALLAVEAGAARAGNPSGRLRVTSLDVGQGDATLVDLPDGEAMLVDAGGLVGSPVDTGERVVLPVLRERRRRRLAVVVLSHPHPDHFGGLAAVLREVEVGELWDTGQGQATRPGPGYDALLEVARARGVTVLGPDRLCDGPHHVGGATVEVLAPCPGVTPERSPNDNSFVLRLVHGERAALLTGDAEREQELELVHLGVELRADLLKVGHHGSRTSSTPAFVDAVRPHAAVVSSGVRNRFGHPHPETVDTFAARGVPLFRVDTSGQLVWETDGERMWLREAGGGLTWDRGSAPSRSPPCRRSRPTGSCR